MRQSKTTRSALMPGEELTQTAPRFPSSQAVRPRRELRMRCLPTLSSSPASGLPGAPLACTSSHSCVQPHGLLKAREPI